MMDVIEQQEIAQTSQEQGLQEIIYNLVKKFLTL